jgi:ATPase subunit of ABC transporter with duplicated ATPase domains
MTLLHGTVSRHAGLTIGRYHQHSTDALDHSSHPIDFFTFTYEKMKRPVDEWRSFLGKFGISGKAWYMLPASSSNAFGTLFS